MHQIGKRSSANAIPLKKFALMLLIVILVGVGLGYAGTFVAPARTSTSIDTKEGNQETLAKTAGVKDKKRFPDTAEGSMKDGGIEGEGSFHLERPGGESQNVYLTSSIIDLSMYIGKKVRVQGQTQKAQKAGWLMDVGYIEVL